MITGFDVTWETGVGWSPIVAGLQYSYYPISITVDTCLDTPIAFVASSHSPSLMMKNEIYFNGKIVIPSNDAHSSNIGDQSSKITTVKQITAIKFASRVNEVWAISNQLTFKNTNLVFALELNPVDGL